MLYPGVGEHKKVVEDRPIVAFHFNVVRKVQ